ncbi:MAG TPA: hypothetical protein VHK27_05495 [Gammaproteobacteria bacterium]|nr:hypothetical protein [Gammaproteobacteria bacterium]
MPKKIQLTFALEHANAYQVVEALTARAKVFRDALSEEPNPEMPVDIREAWKRNAELLEGLAESVKEQAGKRLWRSEK